jgi:putative transposase
MTIDRLHLAELIEKGSDADLLREMMTFVVDRMMDLDVESLTGAANGERSTNRTNQPNGYRERPWHTTLGTLPVAIPKLRKGSYFPSFLEARRTSDKALIAVIQEAYVHVYPRDDLAKAMGLMGISKSQVSRLCEEIDKRVKTFLSRPIEGLWPYVWIDATYVKVREGGRIISVAVIML